MQRALIVLCLVFLSAFAEPVNVQELKALWSSWKIYYGKAYGLAEESARFAIFVENYKKIIKFNSENEGVKQALNKFADLSGEEFKNIHSGCYRPDLHRPELEIYEETIQVVDAPQDVDWREKGAVTPVKDQGQCGSCWSFSTTGALEGFYFINKAKLVSFSEQQIVDCDTNDSGCDGGLPYQAMEYTSKAGVEPETTYPYTAQDGECKYKKLQAVNTNKGYTLVQTKSPTALKNAITNQPVSVAIEADQDVFQFYKSGVITKNCGDSLDHAVLAVGYTTVDSTEAFIVKNSWGTEWGDKGYVYISTDGTQNDGNGVCGILGQPSVPK